MDEQMISCTIDGKPVTVERGTRILDACLAAGIKVPTLCYLKDVSSHGSCGVCVWRLREQSAWCDRACTL
ncbi:MAG: 2Fe-2S iron-sulfur cluster-binding protein [Sphaerochaeta sp.]